mmetsp:Transcript_32544/g.81957  ORF Transcript_32544/g.81957 Transcript_32544/m.81957 type:complete len:232 (+) Transcript_32544:903-1598(+)
MPESGKAPRRHRPRYVVAVSHAASHAPRVGSHALGRLEKGVNGFAERVHDEPDLPQMLVVQDEAAVEHKRGLLHYAVDLLPVVQLELVPLRHDAHRVRAVQRLLGRLEGGDVLRVPLHVLRDLLVGHLGVVDGQLGAVLDEPLAHVDGGGLARVPRVLLEREPQHRDLLPADGVEHGAHHALNEATLLVVVHAHHAVPVVRHLLEPVALADIRQVQNVLLEARPAKPHRRA